MMRDSIQELTIPNVGGARGAAARSWQIASAALVMALAWIIAWYWATGAAMVQTWSRSDTFAHGFVVVPITMWLIWRVRGELASVVPRPSWWVLVPLGAVGFGWLLGELGAVNALSQFAFVAMLVLAVPAVLGIDAARIIAFPLAFLFFAVPFGEFVMPLLMEWTADFTVRAIELTGIPVYREGQNFVIPSGRWSVVEACSGVRYLVASLVVGTLYAYLSYRTLSRRLVFIGFSIVVPIVANWVRAYMIVMIGHLSHNSLAVGVDHLIYGWVFFGAVILIMFWVGGRWREDLAPVAASQRTPARTATSTAASGEFLLVAAAIAVATVVWPLAQRAIERNDAVSTPELPALAAAGDWSTVPTGFTDWRPRFHNPSAELQQTFRRGDLPVGMYVGYFRNQNHERKLVSSNNVMVRTEDRAWTRIGHGVQPLVIGGEAVDASTMVIKSQAGESFVVWYWYWIDGRLTASDARAKAYVALSRLLGRGDDSAIVVIFAPEDRPGAAKSSLEAFVRQMAPAVTAQLQRAREKR